MKTWTYAEIGRMTWSQVRNELYRGKRELESRATVAKAEVARVLADFKAGRFRGSHGQAG